MIRRLLMVSAAAWPLLPSPAPAQMAVVDYGAIAQQIEQVKQQMKQVEQLTEQLGTLKQQLTQLETLSGSLSRLTNMADVASTLNNPLVRKALPSDFSQIEGLLKGNGGSLQNLFDKHSQSSSYYQSDANTFYAQEVARLGKEQAGAQSLGEQIYEAASKRIEGLDELRRQIGTVKEAKESLDLIARFNAEQSFLHIDVLRMQALTMVQRARAEVAERRREEVRLKFQDDVGKLIKSR